MHKLLLSTILLFLPALAAAQEPSEEDAAEIRQLIRLFDTAIESKDLPALTSLFYDGQIVWRATIPPTSAAAMSQMTGKPQAAVEQSGAHLFLNDPMLKDIKLKERFGTPVIDADGQLGSVTFNYAFFANDQIQNWGRENWQLVKTDTGWRILALLFSANLAQVAPMPSGHLDGEETRE